MYFFPIYYLGSLSWTKYNMGSVQIKNCTPVPLKIQLCQVGVLYHDLVKPGECFIRNTGAVHFTIRATVSDKDDTSWTDTVLPILTVTGASLAAMFTAGAGLGLFAGIGISGALVTGRSLLAAAGIVSGPAIVTEAGILAAGEMLLTKELATQLISKAKEEHCYINSTGWYFGGENKLEIHGGPSILADSDGFSYDGKPLRIVDTDNSERHS